MTRAEFYKNGMDKIYDWYEEEAAKIVDAAKRRGEWSDANLDGTLFDELTKERNQRVIDLAREALSYEEEK